MTTGGKEKKKKKKKKVDPISNTKLPTAEFTYKASPREKVLIASNQAVKSKKTSWRESKGGYLGVLKNKFKSVIGRPGYNEKGQCTNNTCVEAVKDYHKSAKQPFSKTDDNRTLRKQLKSGELGYKKTNIPKKGDIVQFEHRKNNIKNYPFHVGVVSDINKRGRPTKYIGTSGTEDPNLKRGVSRKLSKGKETKIRKKHKTQYYTLDKT